MKKFTILALLVAAFCMTSCSSLTRSMREPVVQFQLNSGDYTLSEPLTGTATSVRVFGIDWKRLFSDEGGTINAPIVTSSLNELTELLPTTKSYAVYDLMDANPGYDFVMYPQYKTKTRHFLWLIYSKETTTVTARLGKLNAK